VNLLKECGMENRLEDVLTWYDGYNIAGKEMICPWSIMNFLWEALEPGKDPDTFPPRNYWANSSGNDILEICMKRAKANTSRRLQNLLDGGTEVIKEREFTTYPDIAANNDFDVFATMMMHTGYLTVDKNATAAAGETVAVRIPNREVLECFRDKVNAVFGRSNPVWLEKSQELLAALFAGDADSAATIIRSMLLSFLSSRDSSYEGFYHAFLLGILAIATDEAEEDVDLKSNSERGDGYSDLVLCDDDKAVAAIIEFKKSDSQSRSAWKKLSAEALEQIDKQNYDFNLREDYDVVHKYGIAFHGKHCMVAHKECRNEN
ncbi:MAG: PD-(D/E)XK nuclease domain-containing protein, partial [Succinivibrionaceae bacterium]|nr:PD-(D/E)XK nuclease domain-containing protein [Succinivibrionaceae bacterium]